LTFATPATHQKHVRVASQCAAGRLDVGIVHEGSSHEGVESELIGQISYVLTVPRRLLRSRSGEEVFSGRPIPYAELTGGGVLGSTAARVAKEAGIRLNRVLQSDRVSLLLPAVEHEDLAAFLPAPAAATLPASKFAVVPVKGSQKLTRELVAVWTREGLTQRRAVGTALRPLIRGLQQAISEFERGR
jgi:DNA-binding transcriptional LysR family regulator